MNWVQVEGMETLNFDPITLPKRVMREEDPKRVMREEDPGMKEVVMLILDLVARLVLEVLVVTKLVLEVLVVIKLDLVLVLSARRKAGLKAGVFKGRRARAKLEPKLKLKPKTMVRKLKPILRRRETLGTNQRREQRLVQPQLPNQ